jgi:hypothetical protein
MPDLFGGNGILGQAGYFTNYNLPEVTGYVGIFAVVATVAYFARFTRRGWKGEDREFALFGFLAVSGLVATWGSFTPLGHLFKLIPLFGSTRLQSRNVILVDLAMCVLLAWWFEHVQSGDDVRTGLFSRRRFILAIPAGVMLLTVASLLIWGTSIERWFGAVGSGPAQVHHMPVILGVMALLAVAVLVLVVRTSRRWLVRGIVITMALDLLSFFLFTSSGLMYASPALHGGLGSVEPSTAAVSSLLGHEGRTALVDVRGLDEYAFEQLGLPNMNVFTALPSVQGYGSLIDSRYSNATGTHPRAEVSACALVKGTFAQLRLHAVAINTYALATPVGNHWTPATPCRPLASEKVQRRFFGAELAVSSVTLTPSAPTSEPVVIHFMNATGSIIGAPYDVQLSTTSTSPSQVVPDVSAGPVAGLEVTSVAGTTLRDVAIRVRSGSHEANFDLSSRFQLAFDSVAWKLRSVDLSGPQSFAVFTANSLLPFVSVAKGDATIQSVRSAIWGDTWVKVTGTTPSVVVRRDAYLPGWRATAQNLRTGQQVALTVAPSGLVQSVNVPAGEWQIHFHYHAPYIEVSVAASLLGGFLWSAALALFVRRHRAKAKVLK